MVHRGAARPCFHVGNQGWLKGGARELEGGIGAIHSFSKHVLSTCCVPGSVLGPGDGAVNVKDRGPALTELTC